MPIRPEERDRHPPNWKAISKRIRKERAGDRCECVGQCGEDHYGGKAPDLTRRCEAPNGVLVYRYKVGPAWILASDCSDDPALVAERIADGWRRKATKIVLTVAHLDHNPENVDDENLLAACQRCHLRYDRAHHAETRRRGRDKRTGQASLFDEPFAGLSLNEALDLRGYTTDEEPPAVHGQKRIVDANGDVAFVGRAGDVWTWLRALP